MIFKANAFPAKSFFVSMLTRDIELADAILDLLDNCVDGILRTKWKDGVPDDVAKPYAGFTAEIDLTEDYFRISDNCGGIPRDVAEKYAFVMGRKDERDIDLPTVGMYGIGMKRALFKLGRHSKVVSHTSQESFEVIISQEWLEDDQEWELPISLIERSSGIENGTTIEVCDLYEAIAKSFSKDNSFVGEFKKIVARHYSFIMNKGFEIKINGQTIIPVPMRLLIGSNPHEDALAPYIYQANIDGVDVLLEVGIYRNIPSEQELEDEQVIRRTRDESGWTIICNDRVVLYKDTSLKTGWGESGVPNFHNQFIGIAGVVIFKSNNASKLPLTTTKRGIEGSSELYLRVKNYMREGTKIFTDYTNKWKKDAEGEKKTTQAATLVDVLSVPKIIPDDNWKKIKSLPGNNEQLFKPKLPMPVVNNSRTQVRFTRDKSEIRKVASFLFDDPDVPANEVGNECFETILRSIDK